MPSETEGIYSRESAGSRPGLSVRIASSYSGSRWIVGSAHTLPPGGQRQGGTGKNDPLPPYVDVYPIVVEQPPGRRGESSSGHAQTTPSNALVRMHQTVRDTRSASMSRLHALINEALNSTSSGYSEINSAAD